MQEDMIYVGFSRAAFLFPMQQLKNKHCHHIKKKGKKKKKEEILFEPRVAKEISPF